MQYIFALQKIKINSNITIYIYKNILLTKKLLKNSKLLANQDNKIVKPCFYNKKLEYNIKIKIYLDF